MADYTELITKLRVLATWKSESEVLQQAADAIEELTAFRNTLEDGRLYIMRDGVLYVSSNYKMPDGAKTARLPAIVDFHKEPPKEEK